MIASLACVDAVFIFDEDKPLKWLDILRPNIWVKGSDRTIDTMEQEERRLLESWGTPIKFVPGAEGQSTTNLIEKIVHDHLKEPNTLNDYLREQMLDQGFREEWVKLHDPKDPTPRWECKTYRIEPPKLYQSTIDREFIARMNSDPEYREKVFKYCPSLALGVPSTNDGAFVPPVVPQDDPNGSNGTNTP